MMGLWKPSSLRPSSYAFEHLEIAGYEQLRRVPAHAGDSETASLADRIIAQEHHAGASMKELFPEAASRALQHQV
jgi:ferritin-like metal-binding protein YciE